MSVKNYTLNKKKVAVEEQLINVSENGSKSTLKM